LSFSGTSPQLAALFLCLLPSPLARC